MQAWAPSSDKLGWPRSAAFPFKRPSEFILVNAECQGGHSQKPWLIKFPTSGPECTDQIQGLALHSEHSESRPLPASDMKGRSHAARPSPYRPAAFSCLQHMENVEFIPLCLSHRPLWHFRRWFALKSGWICTWRSLDISVKPDGIFWLCRPYGFCYIFFFLFAFFFLETLKSVTTILSHI